MVSIYDVEPLKLIKRVAEKLEEEKIPKPEWVGKVKSGAHRERLPQDEKFWYIRCASILRNAYVNQVIGVGRLRTHYGARKKRGVKPEKHRKAGGKIIRLAIQTLEKFGYLQKTKKGIGRELTPKGRKLLDNTAYEIYSQKSDKNA
ncbi:MAG: 30S ribosomal protein S19e [Candidatus Micrarchaeota archaeon]|nr:30S ribosomal protein S19e [Candidatus Micrarchaeota archaeon]